MSFKIKTQNLKDAINRLNKVYKKLPQTTGCLQHINKPIEQGGCGGHCCVHNNPSMLYVQFMNSWGNFTQTHSLDQILVLFEKSLRNYLSANTLKTCVFFDTETKLCTTHMHRSMSCRLYGITPNKQYNSKLVQLRILCKKTNQQSLVKQQCRLVSTSNNKDVPTKFSDNIFKDIKKIQRTLQIPYERMNDQAEGTYRTYHDHILIKHFDDSFLAQLSHLRVNGTQSQKNMAIVNVMPVIKKLISKQLGS